MKCKIWCTIIICCFMLVNVCPSVLASIPGTAWEYLGDAYQDNSQSAIVLTKADNFQLGQKLPAPQGLKAQAINANYIKLSWQPVAGADVYRIYRTTAKTGAKLIIHVGRNTSWVDSVEPATAYYYAAVAVDQTGREGKWPQSLQVTTSYTATLENPKNNAIVAKKDFYIKWKPLTGIKRYVLMIKDESNNGKTIAQANNWDKTNYYLSAKLLTGGHKYSIWVIPKRSNGTPYIVSIPAGYFTVEAEKSALFNIRTIQRNKDGSPVINAISNDFIVDHFVAIPTADGSGWNVSMRVCNESYSSGALIVYDSNNQLVTNPPLLIQGITAPTSIIDTYMETFGQIGNVIMRKNEYSLLDPKNEAIGNYKWNDIGPFYVPTGGKIVITHKDSWSTAYTFLMVALGASEITTNLEGIDDGAKIAIKSSVDLYNKEINENLQNKNLSLANFTINISEVLIKSVIDAGLDKWFYRLKQAKSFTRSYQRVRLI